MTAEAARSMAARGIHLDLAHLSEVVEDLRQQEKKEARQMFAEELGMDPGAAAVSQVTDTLGTVKMCCQHRLSGWQIQSRHRMRNLVF